MKIIPALIIGLFLIATLSVPSSNAFTQIVFTSTSDFDSGNNSVYADFFVTNAVDQPTYGFISIPASIRIANGNIDRTYVVYQGDNGYLPYITYYDESLQDWISPVAVNNTNPISPDGHGAPAIWIDSSGYIWVFWGSHDTASWLRVSCVPYEISCWTIKPNAGINPTYPHLFEYNGYVYFLYRQPDEDWLFQRSNTHGDSWIAGNNILVTDDWTTGGWYIYNHVHTGNRVYYSFVRLEKPSGFRFDTYSCYWNLDDGNQYSISGTNLGITITQTEAESSCKAQDTGLNHTWVNAMDIDSANNPYMIYTENTTTGDGWNISFTRWNGSSWTAPIRITTTDGSSSYVALNAFTNTSVEAFLITDGLHQFAYDDYSGDLERWTWNGTVWLFEETIYSEVRAGRPVNRPIVPLNYNSRIRVVFDTWSAIPTENPPIMRMYAWGTNGYVGAKRYLETVSTETMSNNNALSSGTIQLSKGTGDTFFTNDSDASNRKWKNQVTGDGDGVITYQFINGVWNVTVNTVPTGSGRNGDSIISAFELSGNWDVRFRYNVTNERDGAFGAVVINFCLYNEPWECDSIIGSLGIELDGFFYQYVTEPYNIFGAAFVVNGTAGGVGSSTFVTCDPCWLRLQRSGNTINYYYSGNGISWTLDETHTLTIPITTLYASISFSGSDNQYTGVWSIEGDEFIVTSGDVSFVGEVTGTWISPEQTWNNEVPDTVVLIYNGASSNQRIERLTLLNNDTGAVLSSIEANVSSGESFTWGISDSDSFNFFDVNWVLRIDLSGSGSGLLSIQSITLNTERSKISIAIYDTPMIMVFVALITLGLMGAFWFKRKRGG